MKNLLKGLNRKRRGEHAEDAARQFLEQQQLVFIERNFHSRFGEIDLVMNDNQTLVFVEVRMRSSDKFGGALASVDYRKQQKLLKTGAYYLQSKNKDCYCRFDVIAINGEGDVEWIKSAFTAE